MDDIGIICDKHHTHTHREHAHTRYDLKLPLWLPLYDGHSVCEMYSSPEKGGWLLRCVLRVAGETTLMRVMLTGNAAGGATHMRWPFSSSCEGEVEFICQVPTLINYQLY